MAKLLEGWVLDSLSPGQSHPLTWHTQILCSPSHFVLFGGGWGVIIYSSLTYLTININILLIVYFAKRIYIFYWESFKKSQTFATRSMKMLEHSYPQIDKNKLTCQLEQQSCHLFTFDLNR